MGNVTKKSTINGLVWIRGSLGEGQPLFQVVVNKPITLDQGEKIAMLLKHSIDEARARTAAQKEATGRPIDHDACVVHDREPASLACEACGHTDGSHSDTCSIITDMMDE